MPRFKGMVKIRLPLDGGVAVTLQQSMWEGGIAVTITEKYNLGPIDTPDPSLILSTLSVADVAGGNGSAKVHGCLVPRS